MTTCYYHLYQSKGEKHCVLWASCNALGCGWQHMTMAPSLPSNTQRCSGRTFPRYVPSTTITCKYTSMAPFHKSSLFWSFSSSSDCSDKQKNLLLWVKICETGNPENSIIQVAGRARMGKQGIGTAVTYTSSSPELNLCWICALLRIIGERGRQALTFTLPKVLRVLACPLQHQRSVLHA